MARPLILKSLFKNSNNNAADSDANDDTLAFIRLLAVTVVLPLLIAAFGTWGRYDHYSQYHAVTAEQFQLDNLIERIESSKTAKGTYPSSATFEKDGTTYHGKDALIEAQITRIDVIATRIVQAIRGIFPPIIAISGAISALSALFLITLSKVAIWNGEKYSGTIIANFKYIAKYIPYILVLQTATFYISLIAGAWFFAFSLFHVEAISFGAIKLIIILPLLLYGSVWLSRRAFHQIKKSRDLLDVPPLVLIGQEINRETSQGLWELVTAAASKSKNPLPDNIIIGIESGIYGICGEKILEDQSLNPATKYINGNTLYISLPQISLLSRFEAMAIIARELSFFAPNEIAYSREFLPSFYRLGKYVSGLESEEGLWLLQPSSWLGQYALNHFALALDKKRFDRALNADKNAAAIAGNEVLVQSLLKTLAITKAINEETDKIGVLTQNLPQNLVTAIVAKGVNTKNCRPELPLYHPYESELPIKERMAYFEIYDLSFSNAIINGQNNPAAYFADYPNLCEIISRLYIAYIQKDAEKYKNFLTAQIMRVTGREFALYNISKSYGILSFILGAACAGGVFAINKLTHGHDWRTLGLGIGIAAVILVAVGIYLIVIGWRPFIYINPEYIKIRGIKNPIPWDKINDAKVINTSGITTRFILDNKIINELGLSHHPSYAVINKNQGAIDVYSMVPRGFSRKSYAALIKNFRSAALAKRIFKENNIPLPEADII